MTCGALFLQSKTDFQRHLPVADFPLVNISAGFGHLEPSHVANSLFRACERIFNGFLESFTFDPARPTSLLYKKTATGYELVGAMYTMPRNSSEDQLNERLPLSIAMWHQHTNLCFPRLSHLRDADWTKFGLQGSIATQDACDAAGGRFHPVVLGWMTHVYPYADSTDKIFAMHMD